MRAIDPLGGLFGRLHIGVRRRLNPGAFLADSEQRTVYNRLRAVKPRELCRYPIAQTRFVVIDTETTGFQAYAGDEIVSIALIELQGVEPTGRVFTSLVNPGRPIPPASTAIHQLTDADVAEAPSIAELLPDIVRFIGESTVIGHHVSFDLRFLNKTLQPQFLCRIRHPWLDTMLLFLAVSGRLGHYSLEEVAQFCDVEIHDRHTAYGDAVATAAMFKVLVSYLPSGSYPVSRLLKWQTHMGQLR